MDLDFSQTGAPAPSDQTTPVTPPLPPVPAPAPTPVAPKPVVEEKPMPAMAKVPSTEPPMSPKTDMPNMTESDLAASSETHKKSRLIPILIAIFVLLLIGGGVWYYLMQKSATKTPAATTVPLDNSTTSTTTNTSSSSTATTPAARDTVRKGDLTTIKSYLDTYFATNGSYPIANSVVKLSDASSVITTALVPSVTASLPSDPKAPDYWYGYKSTDGKTYQLTARLEDTTDPSGVLEGTNYIYRITGDSSAVTTTTPADSTGTSSTDSSNFSSDFSTDSTTTTQ